MNRLLAPSALLVTLLCACSPVNAQKVLSNPILSEGQEWVLNMNLESDGIFYPPLDLIVGKQEISRNGSAAFIGKPISDSFITLIDLFAYNPVDEDPDFILAGQLSTLLGINQFEYCVVKTPSLQIGLKQNGVAKISYNVKKLFEEKLLDDINLKNYVDTGTIKDLRICTLTRIK